MKIKDNSKDEEIYLRIRKKRRYKDSGSGLGWRMAAAQDGRRPIRGGKLLWPIATLLVHLRFPAPLTLAAGRPAAWTVPCPFSFRSRIPLTILILARPAARVTSCPRSVGTAKRVVLTYDNLSRLLQPGYNYVGQTNDRQPLLISAVGRLRDYLPTADCCVGPGPHEPNQPSTLIPAVRCRSRILKHSYPPTLRMAAAQDTGWKTTVADSHAARPPLFPGTPHHCGRPPGCLDCPLSLLLPVSHSAYHTHPCPPGRPRNLLPAERWYG
jgi:hypothetical protein